MEGKAVAVGEKEKQGKKRPVPSLSGDEEVKSVRVKSIDDEVDEFFTIVRRIRETSRLLGGENPRNPCFQLEDFSACGCHEGGDGGGNSSAATGKTSGSGTREGELVGNEGEKKAKLEASEDNGLPARLDLKGGSGNGSRQQMLKRRGRGSALEEGEDE